jgi:hypothetical protein
MNIDIVRYSERLSPNQSGQDEDKEEKMLRRFPPGHEGNMCLDKPATILDVTGAIIVWYLPDALNATTQVWEAIAFLHDR